jgi:hypothetical protein
MRREPDFFGDAELTLVYLARRLRESLEVEELLTKAGIDYVVETGTYLGGFLFRRELTGAYFYVAADNAVAARSCLHQRPFFSFTSPESRDTD